MSTLTVVRGTTELVLTFGDGSTSLVVAPTGSRTSLLIAGGPPGPRGITDDVSLLFVLDGGGSDLSAGIKAGIDDLPFAGEIISWTLTTDAPGDIEIDLWKDLLANYPPTLADSITGGAAPSLSGVRAAHSSALTGWTTTFAPGDCIVPNIVNVTGGITLARITLRVRRL